MARADREREILDAAAEVFGTSGYAHTSVVAVARRADVSKPLVYDYFGSKDGLFIACVDRAGTNLVEHVAAVQEGTSLDRALRTLGAIFEALEPRRSDWRVLHDTTLPQGSPVLERALHHRRELFRLAAEGTQEVLAARGITQRDEVDLTARLWSSTVITTVDWWLDRPDVSPDEAVALCGDLLVAFAGQPSGSGRTT